jgi:hypothetical protein
MGLSLAPYAGLGFWAKASIGGEQTIHVQLQDMNSDPRAGNCAKDPSDHAAVKANCYNGFAKPLTLTESFERYEVDFAELRRDPNWGHGSLESLRLDQLYLLSFEVRSPKCIADPNGRYAGGGNLYLSFDIWVDAVYLYER